MNPERIASVLTAVIIILIPLHFIHPFCVSVLDRGSLYGIVEICRRLFSMQDEANVPTWFSALLFLACAFVAYPIARFERARRARGWRSWYFVTGLFTLLSFDEASQIHENWKPIREPLIYRGVIPDRQGFVSVYFEALLLLPIVAIVAIALLPWFFGLPKKARYLLFASGVIFVTGGVMMDCVIRYIGYANMGMMFEYSLYAIEEVLEMFGVLIALYVFLDLARARSLRFRFDFDPARRSP